MRGATDRNGTPKHTRAAVAARRTKAIDLRQAGVDLVTVGRQLRYGKWSSDAPDAEQITTDRNLARLVRQDIDRGLADRRAALNQSGEEYVQAAVERLERLRAALWADAMNRKVAAVRECLRIEEQLARLLGYQQPVKHALTLTADLEAQVEQAAAELVEFATSTGLRPVPDAGAQEA